jgi:hypothetical protein
MQTVSAVAPAVLEVLPAEHVVHVVLDTAPEWVENVPGAQLVHPRCPATSENFPAVQAVHVAEPMMDELPTVQGMQTSALVAAV